MTVRERDGENQTGRHKHSQRHRHSQACICSFISDTNSLINYIALVSGKNSSTRKKWKIRHFEALCMLRKCCPKLQTQCRSLISLWKIFYCNDFIRKKNAFKNLVPHSTSFIKLLYLLTFIELTLSSVPRRLESISAGIYVKASEKFSGVAVVGASFSQNLKSKQ